MWKFSLLCISALVLIMLAAGGCSDGSQERVSAASSKMMGAMQDLGTAVQDEAAAAENSVLDAVDDRDKEVSRAVRQAILDQPDVRTTQLEVSAKDETVTLRGTVPTEVENQIAEHAARDAVGSSYRVDDQITVCGN